MNRVSSSMGKGSRREREFVGLCHEARLATYRPATVQYSENDIFGLVDVLAFSPSHRRFLAFQVKSNGARGIEAWTRHTSLLRRLGLRTFYACPYDREGWRVIEVDSTRHEDVVDERKAGEWAMGEGVVEWLELEAQA